MSRRIMKNCGHCKHLRDDSSYDIGECIKNNYKYFEKKEAPNGNSNFKPSINKDKQNNSSDDKSNTRGVRNK